MRIGIDVRCLAEGKRTGVEEYTVRVLENLFKKKEKVEFILFFNSFKGSRECLSWVEQYRNVEIRDFRFPNKLLNFSLWFFRWPKLDLLIGGVDVFFAPNINFIALSPHCKKVLTIHDLSFERLAETFSLKRRLWHFLINPRRLCQEFDRILAVSESTKQDLVGLYQLEPEKVTVAMPPLDFKNFSDGHIKSEEKEAVRKKYNLPSKFILYLGTIEPRKNIEGLIVAFEALREEKGILKDIRLVIAGSRGWKCAGIYQRWQQSPQKEEIIFTDFVADQDKAFLYQLAQIFVYPSFFEGFGFPPLEAMAAGIPVVTANCSSLPEVVQDAAILIDPYRPYEITLAMKALLEDEALYQEYQKRGKERIRELSEKNLNFEIMF